MSKLKTKQKVALIVVAGIVGTILTIAAIGFFGYLVLFHCDYGRVYNDYVEYDGSYYSVEITVKEIIGSRDGQSAYLYVKNPQNSDYSYWICGKNYQTLVDSDFFDVVAEDTVITIYSHPYIAWDGWVCPLLGVTVGDQEYLDFETGKQNWLDTLKQLSEDYGFLQTPIKER